MKKTQNAVQEAARQAAALTTDQQDRLHSLTETLLASKEGRATEADVMRCILNTPKEYVQTFTEILRTLGGNA